MADLETGHRRRGTPPMPEHGVRDGAEDRFAPEVLLPTQYFDRVRRRKDLTGEQRLLCAVIEHAIDDYMKYAAGTDRHRQGLFADAERWVESTDRTRLYAFETICDHLGLDADYVRRGLRGWRARARSGAGPAVSISEVAAAPERRHASNE